MPYAVDGVAAFVQRHGPLLRAMARRGLTRGQARLRFLLLFPEESPALFDAALAQLGERFRPGAAAPEVGDEAVRAGIWLALAQHLGLAPDPQHAAVHLSHETVRDVTALLTAGDPDGDVTRRALGLIGAAQRHAAEQAPPALSAREYEHSRLGLCTEAQFLCSLAHYWPAPERTVAQRLGGGSWSAALQAMGFATGPDAEQERIFTEEEYAAAVTAFLADCRRRGRRPTTTLYGRWAVEQAGARTPRPYFDGVRRFFGSWEEAMRFAAGRQHAGPDGAEGYADTRTWSDLATPEAQEMLGRAGIGVVTHGAAPQPAGEEVWEDLQRLITTVLARLPWNDFLVVEYEPVHPGAESPAAWAESGPQGVRCAVLSGGQFVHAEWPVDATFFHEDEWEEPAGWDQPWTTGPTGFREAAQKLVDGLRFGWGCADPYRFHWGVGSFPAEPAGEGLADVVAARTRVPSTPET